MTDKEQEVMKEGLVTEEAHCGLSAMKFTLRSLAETTQEEPSFPASQQH